MVQPKPRNRLQLEKAEKLAFMCQNLRPLRGVLGANKNHMPFFNTTGLGNEGQVPGWKTWVWSSC